MKYVYDVLATLGFIVCFAIGFALIFAVAAYLWAGMNAFRRSFRASYRGARYTRTSEGFEEERGIR